MDKKRIVFAKSDPFFYVFLAPITGAALDFIHDKLNVTHSYAVELRPTSQENGGFLLPPDQIEPTFQEFLNGFMESIKEINNQNSLNQKDIFENKEQVRKIITALIKLVNKSRKTIENLYDIYVYS